MKIIVTGRGVAGQGVAAVLDYVKVKKIEINDFLTKTYSEPVYCQIEALDCCRRKDGKEGSLDDFFKNGGDYESCFMKFAKVADMYVTAHFWSVPMPFIFTRDDARENEQSPDFNIKVVADVSCDLDGPVACTVRSTSIADPIYGYDPKTEKETPDFKRDGVICVMAVDNLPCELPRDAATSFGEQFLGLVFPALLDGDKDGILARGKMAGGGKLGEKFTYLQNFIDGKE